MPNPLPKRSYLPVFGTAKQIANPLDTAVSTKGIAGPAQIAADTPDPSRFQQVFSAAQQGMDKVVPYASNIINSLRRTPRPKAPRAVAPVTPARVNYDAQRVETDAMVRGANLAADRNLDENTAAAVKAGSLATAIRAKNQISQQEANTNAHLQGQASQINASIDAQNASMFNRYQDQQLESQIASQRNSAANIANAADKYIAQQNESNAANLDLDKLNVLTQMFKNSGVYNRLIDNIKKTSDDPTGTGYMKAFGGPLDPNDPHNTVGEGGKGYVNPTKPSLDRVRMNEQLSYSILNGGNPMTHDNGKGLFELADSLYGREKAQGLINEVMLFNQDTNNNALSKEDKIRKFYANKNSIAQQFNIADPVALYNTSPNVGVQKQLVASRKYGGHYKRVY